MKRFAQIFHGIGVEPHPIPDTGNLAGENAVVVIILDTGGIALVGHRVGCGVTAIMISVGVALFNGIGVRQACHDSWLRASRVHHTLPPFRGENVCFNHDHNAHRAQHHPFRRS